MRIIRFHFVSAVSHILQVTTQTDNVSTNYIITE